jgi:hypothetical protein
VPESVSLLSEPQGEYDSAYQRSSSSSSSASASSGSHRSSSSSSGGGGGGGNGWINGINIFQNLGGKRGEPEQGAKREQQQASPVASGPGAGGDEEDQFYVRMLAELVELGRELASDADKDLAAVQLAAGVSSQGSRGEGDARMMALEVEGEADGDDFL